MCSSSFKWIEQSESKWGCFNMGCGCHCGRCVRGWPAREPKHSASRFTRLRSLPQSASTRDTSAVVFPLEGLIQQIHPFTENVHTKIHPYLMADYCERCVNIELS